MTRAASFAEEVHIENIIIGRQCPPFHTVPILAGQLFHGLKDGMPIALSSIDCALPKTAQHEDDDH
jgi:hypothetical protein